MKRLHLIMGILSLLGIVASAEPLNVGAKAPVVVQVDQGGNKVDLGQVYAKGLTLVYFYPKADTPGCTAEACSLRDAFVKLQEKGIQVIGVSADKPDAQAQFKTKYSLPFTLLADADRTVIQAFGVPATMGFASRQSFLIKDGVVVWRDLKASTAEQAADVLKAAESL